MSVIGTHTFGGMQPQIDQELIPDSVATVAVNARILSGKLNAWNLPAPVLTLSSLPTVETIYRFGQNIDSATQFWFEFTGDVDVVKGAVATDTQERTYWTDGTYPKKTDSTMATGAPPYPSASYRMGVPRPSAAPAVAIGGSTNGNDPNTPTFTSTYFVTFVTAWGEESGNSPASALATWQPPGQHVVLTGLPAAPSGPYAITKIRIYRSNTGSKNTDAQFAVELPIGTTTWTDTLSGDQLGDTLATWDWDPPPDNMIGLTSMGNGILAGFAGNTLCFCEPGVPYAWPVKYQQAMTEPIVGIAPFGQSLFVGTTRGSYLFTGVDPANMTQETISEAQSCVSKRSVVMMLGGVVWASPDGLYIVSPSGAQNLTQDVFSREEWQAYKPESIKGYTYNDRYYACYDTGSKQGTLIFTFGDKPSFVTCDQVFTAAFVDRLRDQMFIVQAGNALKTWDAGAPMTMTWRSKTYPVPGTFAPSAARVEAVTYPVTFRLIVDGAQVGPDISVANVYPFRLPAVLAESTCAYEVEGTGTIDAVYVASSADELPGMRPRIQIPRYEM